MFSLQDRENIDFVINTTKATKDSNIKIIDKPTRGMRHWIDIKKVVNGKEIEYNTFVNLQNYVFYNNFLYTKEVRSKFLAGYCKANDTIYYCSLFG